MIDESELHNHIRYILDSIGKPETREHKQLCHEFLTKYTAINNINKGRKTYPQNWSAYNQAQQNEKILLMQILDELLSYIDFPPITKGKGRKPIPLRDKIFYIVMQSYNIKSSRRCISDLEIAKKYQYINKTPHFNTILKTQNDKTITHYLKHLIEISVLPLQNIEKDFAIDSTGFSTTQYGRWYDVRIGKKAEKRQYKKVHITCGTKTNIITAINITPGTEADCPQFINLIKKTTETFPIREISADKGYTSRQNLETAWNIGAIPLIPFRKNTNKKGLGIWKKLYTFYTQYPDEFYHHYHKRSNVETTFNMIKTKLGVHLRTKNETAQDNEILTKILCHNIIVLIHETFELGINTDFKTHNKNANLNNAHLIKENN